MTQKPKIQTDASTSDRLIEAAETLYGMNGLDGVSLRQISIAAGTGNNYAVQYHFGDAFGLIRAILEKRAPEVELLRAQMLSKLKPADRTDTRALMDVLYRPLIEHTDSRGERSYARFVLVLHSAPESTKPAIDRFPMMPIAEHVIGLLAAINSEIPASLLLERQRLISIMVLTSIFNRRPPFDGSDLDAALIDNVLNMASAAIVAPVCDEMRTIISDTSKRKKSRK